MLYFQIAERMHFFIAGGKTSGEIFVRIQYQHPLFKVPVLQSCI